MILQPITCLALLAVSTLPPPQNTPQLYGPASTAAHDLALRFSRDLRFCDVMRSSLDWNTAIVRMEHTRDGWRETGLAPLRFTGVVSYPAEHPDGQSLVFDGSEADEPPDLWRTRREEGGWGAPERLGPSVNSPAVEMHGCFAANGNLYFSSNRPGGAGDFDLYRATWNGHAYAAAENLGPAVNASAFDAHPWISPDESMLLFDSRRPGGHGANDLYVCFRRPDGSWSPARNLGPAVNTEAGEMRPYLPPGGGRLFFCSDRSRSSPRVPPPNLEAFRRRVQGPGNGSQDLYFVSLAVLKSLQQQEASCQR